MMDIVAPIVSPRQPAQCVLFFVLNMWLLKYVQSGWCPFCSLVVFLFCFWFFSCFFVVFLYQLG